MLYNIKQNPNHVNAGDIPFAMHSINNDPYYFLRKVVGYSCEI